MSLADIINIPSGLALRQRNDTFGPKKGVLIQLFKNPHGMLVHETFVNGIVFFFFFFFFFISRLFQLI